MLEHVKRIQGPAKAGSHRPNVGQHEQHQNDMNGLKPTEFLVQEAIPTYRHIHECIN